MRPLARSNHRLWLRTHLRVRRWVHLRRVHVDDLTAIRVRSFESQLPGPFFRAPQALSKSDSERPQNSEGAHGRIIPAIAMTYASILSALRLPVKFFANKVGGFVVPLSREI